MSIDTEELSDAVAESLFSARRWHTGQRSALYCWASSATPVAGLAAEAQSAATGAGLLLADCEDSETEELLTDREALWALADWAEERGL